MSTTLQDDFALTCVAIEALIFDSLPLANSQDLRRVTLFLLWYLHCFALAEVVRVYVPAQCFESLKLKFDSRSETMIVFVQMT